MDIGTNPFDIDTDRNGWQDNLDPNPLSADSDDDGLWDFVEMNSTYNGRQTDWLDADSDDDGIADGDEDVNLNGMLDEGETDPTNADTDGDGIQDGTELGIAEPVSKSGINGADTSIFIPDADEGATITDPLMADSDGDGLPDGWIDEDTDGTTDPGEFEDFNFNGMHEPQLNESRPDKAYTDTDLLDDLEEVVGYGTNPNNPDTDGDGLWDCYEVSLLGTDPNNPDTDGDGLKDGAELYNYGTDPLDQDTDKDGLNDGEEVNTHNTDPNNPDTDGDGVSDKTEIDRGTNPNNIPPEAYFEVIEDDHHANEPVEFDASGSKDEDGFIVEYCWNFGDGVEECTSASSIEHTYESSGYYTVTLTVVDNKGDSDSYSLQIEILKRNEPPHAIAYVSLAVGGEMLEEIKVKTGQALKFDGTESYDEDGQITEYKWTFGCQGCDPDYGRIVPFTYTTAGAYVAKLTVTDDEGASAHDYVNVYVEEPKPPDPRIEKIEVYPSSPHDGDIITVKVIVRNYGDEEISSPDLAIVRIWDIHPDESGAEQPLLDTRIYNLKPGESRTFRVTSENNPRLGLVGEHKIKVLIGYRGFDEYCRSYLNFEVRGEPVDAGVVYLGLQTAIGPYGEEWGYKHGRSDRDHPSFWHYVAMGKEARVAIGIGRDDGGDVAAYQATRGFIFKESTYQKLNKLSHIEFVFDIDFSGAAHSYRDLCSGESYAKVEVRVEGKQGEDW